MDHEPEQTSGESDGGSAEDKPQKTALRISILLIALVAIGKTTFYLAFAVAPRCSDLLLATGMDSVPTLTNWSLWSCRLIQEYWFVYTGAICAATVWYLFGTERSRKVIIRLGYTLCLVLIVANLMIGAGIWMGMNTARGCPIGAAG